MSFTIWENFVYCGVICRLFLHLSYCKQSCKEYENADFHLWEWFQYLWCTHRSWTVSNSIFSFLWYSHISFSIIFVLSTTPPVAKKNYSSSISLPTFVKSFNVLIIASLTNVRWCLLWLLNYICLMTEHFIIYLLAFSFVPWGETVLYPFKKCDYLLYCVFFFYYRIVGAPHILNISPT